MMEGMDDPMRPAPGHVPPPHAGRPPAPRFLERYERRRAEDHGRFVRPIRVLAGVLLILFGIAIGWLPGPGFVIFAIPGSFLVGSEIRRAAVLLDRVEAETLPRVQRVHARLRGGPKPGWVEAAPERWARWCEDRRRMELPDSGQRRRSSDTADAFDVDPGPSAAPGPTEAADGDACTA